MYTQFFFIKRGVEKAMKGYKRARWNIARAKRDTTRLKVKNQE